jgi:hypothetical protein
MVVAQTNRITRSTLLAMEEILTPTNSANSTVIAMKLLFFSIIIIEYADAAKIFSHVDTTIRTNLSCRLLCIANRTNHLFNVLTNKIVTVVDIAQCASALVVTMATIEDFVATWSSDLASPLVMLTPETHFAKMKSIIG